MIGLPDGPRRLCQLAVERGYLNERQVDEVFARGEDFSSAEEAGDWLVKAGLLSQEEWHDLRATWTTVHSGEAPAPEEGEREPGPRQATVDLPHFSAETRLPNIPGYQIVEEIGRGGMGAVYRARQGNPSRWVALKVMLAGAYASQQARHRFAREIEATASMNHPGVVPVYEAGEQEGIPYYTMECVDGEPMLSYLRRHPLSLRQKLELFQRVCDAVVHAHSQGLVHRDLKPSNILVEKSGRPRVLDFGLAKFLVARGAEHGESLVTRAGTLVGTYAYMSPEQARGLTDQVDERSDIYSLGVILYEILTGRLPHTGETSYLVVRAICNDDPARPSTIDRNLRGDLETIILTCLEKSKERRYQNVAALTEDIGRYLNIEPISAKPASGVTRALKFVRRNRIIFSSSLAAVALAAVTGLALHFAPIYVAMRRVDSAEPAIRELGWKALRARAPGLGLGKAIEVLRNAQEPGRGLEAIRYMQAPEVAGRQRDIVPALSAALDAGWPEVREGALDRLVLVAPQEVLRWGARTVSSGTPEQKAEALAALRRVDWRADGASVLSAVKGALDSADASLRALAWQALTSRAPVAAVVSLVSVLQSTGPAEQKVEALDALQGMSPLPRDTALERVLFQYVRDGEDGKVRRRSAEMLVRLGAHVEWPVLRELLLGEMDPPVGEQLARLVGASGDPQAPDALCDALQAIEGDPFPLQWKAFALELITQIGEHAQPTGRVRTLLVEALGLHDVDVQLRVIEAIGRLNIPSDQVEQWAPPLVPFLSVTEQEVQQAAFTLLCRLAAPSTASAVAQALARITDNRALESAERRAEEMHSLLLKRDPQAAATVRKVLLAAVRTSSVLVPQHYAFIVAEPWQSSEQLGAYIGAANYPESLEYVATQLDSDTEVIRQGAAHCLRLLTGGRIDPDKMTLQAVKDMIAEGWRWDPERSIFVPRDGG